MSKYFKIDRNYRDYLLMLVNKRIKSTYDKIRYYSFKGSEKYKSKILDLHSELVILESIKIDVIIK